MKRQPRSNPRSHKTLRTVSIVGTGSYVPEKVLTNEDLSRMVDTSDEWITTRTGIKERRIAAKDENTSDMAAKAALNAIEQAKISPREIDLILWRRRRLTCFSRPQPASFRKRLGRRTLPASTLPQPAPVLFSDWKSRSSSSRRTHTTPFS